MAYEIGKLCQRHSDEAIPRGVYGQFIESAGYLAPLKQLPDLRASEVNATPHSVKHTHSRSPTQAQVSLQSPLHLMHKNLSNQVGYFVWILLQGCQTSSVKLAVEFGSIQQQEPDVSNWNSMTPGNDRFSQLQTL